MPAIAKKAGALKRWSAEFDECWLALAYGVLDRGVADVWLPEDADIATLHEAAQKAGFDNLLLVDVNDVSDQILSDPSTRGVQR